MRRVYESHGFLSMENDEQFLAREVEEERREEGLFQLLAPNGQRITGTLERLYGRGQASGWYREDGRWIPEWAGEVDVFWDGQQTVEVDGIAILLDEDGNEWPEVYCRPEGERGEREQETADTIDALLDKLYEVAQRHNDRSVDFDICAEVRAARAEVKRLRDE